MTDNVEVALEKENRALREDRDRLRQQVLELDARAERAEADNAALLQGLLDSLEVPITPELREAVRSRLAAEIHPGAALLAELKAARGVVGAARAVSRSMATYSNDETKAGHISAEVDLDHALRAYDAVKK